MSKKITEIINELEKGGMGSGKKPGIGTHLVQPGVKKEPVKTTSVVHEMATRGTSNIFDTMRAKAAASGGKPSPLFRSDTPTDDLVEEYSKAHPKAPKAGTPIRFKKDPAVVKKISQMKDKQLKDAGISKPKKPKMGD